MKEDSGNLDVRDLEILEKIESNGHLTQRDLSKEVGIAVGLVNLLLKKRVKKGWIKINNIDAKKIKYQVKSLCDKNFTLPNLFYLFYTPNLWNMLVA